MSTDVNNPSPPPEAPTETTGPAFRSPAAEQQFRAVAGDHLAALDRLPEGARAASMAAIAADPIYSHFFAEPEPIPEPETEARVVPLSAQELLGGPARPAGSIGFGRYGRS